MSPFDPGLKPGDVISNKRINEIFTCGTQGGMRRSHATGTLVLVSDHTRGVYHDRWEGNILHYTGTGRFGDQKLKGTQNRTLAETPDNGVDVYLFEVFKSNNYVFHGEVVRAGDYYEEEQLDEADNPRNALVFPLSLADGMTPQPVNVSQIQDLAERERRRTSKLSDRLLKKRAEAIRGKAGERNVTSKQYVRNEHVAIWAKRRAKGMCQLCEEPAPFNGKRGDPYLEVHHILWLAREGEDTIENAVALCPNCHRKMHVLDKKSDRDKLTSIALKLSQ